MTRYCLGVPDTSVSFFLPEIAQITSVLGAEENAEETVILLPDAIVPALVLIVFVSTLVFSLQCSKTALSLSSFTFDAFS